MRDSKSVAAICSIGLGASMGAQAAEGDLLMRVRATYLDFDNGQNGLPVEVLADSRWIPEVDFSYFLADNFSTELVLTWPQKVDISVDGADAGSVNALPPTLLAQYHFPDLGALRPYVGAGLNLTLFSERGLLDGAARTDKSSVGFALQIGADAPLNERWSLNADIKYIDMHAGVHVTGTKIGNLDLNPWVASVGFGYELR